MADPQPPAEPASFEYDGGWPFTGTPTVNGHPLSTVTNFQVQVGADSIPIVTLTLVGASALKLALGAARVHVSDATREALVSLGWKPPAD